MVYNKNRKKVKGGNNMLKNEYFYTDDEKMKAKEHNLKVWEWVQHEKDYKEYLEIIEKKELEARIEKESV